MGKFNLKKLPKNFRYLFSLKEIKEIENFAGLKFKNITNGSLTNSKKINKDAYIQGSFRSFSIHSIKTELNWEFSLHQDGFREELLPAKYEEELKTLLSKKIKDYLHQIYYSKETDCYKNPKLWAFIMIIENELEVSWKETR
jgi:hypothetical protein